MVPPVINPSLYSLSDMSLTQRKHTIAADTWTDLSHAAHRLRCCYAGGNNVVVVAVVMLAKVLCPPLGK